MVIIYHLTLCTFSLENPHTMPFYSLLCGFSVQNVECSPQRRAPSVINGHTTRHSSLSLSDRTIFTLVYPTLILAEINHSPSPLGATRNQSCQADSPHILSQPGPGIVGQGSQ